MPKREGENRQLQQHELDRMDEKDVPVAGSYQKASADTISKRVIKRANLGSARKKTEGPGPVNPFASAKLVPDAPAANPFGGVKLAPSAPAPAGNPFGGINLIPSSSAPTPSVNPFGGVTLAQTSPAPTSSLSSSAAAFKPSTSSPSAASSSTTSTVVSGDSSEYRKRMAKLNASLAAFMKRHPKGDWRDALTDYIKYTKDLKKRFLGNVDADTDEEKEKDAPSSSSSSSSAFGGASFGGHSTAAPAPKAAPASTLSAARSSTDKPVMDFSGKISTDRLLFQAPKTENPFASATSSSTFGAPANSSANAVTSNPFASTAPNPFASSATSGSGSGSGNGGVSGSSNPFGGGNPFASSSGSSSSGSNNPFSSNPFSSSSSSSQAPAATGGEGDDDAEGEPELEPEEVHKNNKDKTIEVEHERLCKLMRLRDEGTEWLDCGKGNASIVRDTDSGKKRIIVRNQMGNILVNAYFFKQQKFTLTKNSKGVPNGVKFMAVVEVQEGKDEAKMKPRTFLVKFKPEDVVTMHEKLSAVVQALQ